MLDLEEISSAIKELENSQTTYDTCIKLAALYTVRNELTASDNNPVVVELKDILPQYREYCSVKRRYQMQEVPDTAVHSAMQYLCDEIVEFLHTLYSNSDTRLERSMLRDMILDLSNEKWIE